jgi:fatty-acyl-CoA synthase
MDSLDWIGKWADYTPLKTAVVSHESNEVFRYKDLDEYANNLSVHFEKLKLTEGDRIAILAEHGPFYIILLACCQRMGLILTPLNYRLAPFEITHLLEDCNPKLLIYSETFVEKLDYNSCKNIPNQINVNNIKNLYQEKTLQQHSPRTIKENNAIFLFYTSGTTGKPKGVLYTNKMMFWNSLNTSMQLGITFKDSTLNVLPPYHTSGWNIFITPILHKGGSITIIEKFDPEKTLQLLEETKTTLFLALPTMLLMMQKTSQFQKVDLSALRYIISGGEIVGFEMVSHWKKHKNIDIRPGYGLTEAGPSITSLHHDKTLEKPNSIGKPNFYLDLKIVNENNEEVKNNEVGEICISGNIITPAYWNNSIETKNKIKDGWLYTGDLAYRDEEGYLFLKGRKDDMYISGGENIYPQEIESFIEQIPTVTKAIVLPIEDNKWGKSSVAFVTSTDSSMNEFDIRQYLKGNLADYKHPKAIFLLNEIPLTSLGKVSRKQLFQYFHSLISES